MGHRGFERPVGNPASQSVQKRARIIGSGDRANVPRATRPVRLRAHPVAHVRAHSGTARVVGCQRETSGGVYRRFARGRADDDAADQRGVIGDGKRASEASGPADDIPARVVLLLERHPGTLSDTTFAVPFRQWGDWGENFTFSEAVVVVAYVGDTAAPRTGVWCTLTVFDGV